MKSNMLAYVWMMFFLCLTHMGYCEPVLNQASNQSKLDMALVLMKKCGICKQFDQVPEKTKMEILENFKQNESLRATVEESAIDEIGQIINCSFKPQVIKSSVADYIATHLSVDDMAAVIAWLDSPLGKKITHMEEIASTPEAYKEMVATIPALKLASDYEERLDLVHEIDKRVKATELILDRMLTMQLITVTSLSQAFPSMNLPTETEIKEEFNQNRQSMFTAISREIGLSILYTYRDISKEDLRAYIHFMESDPGKRYHKVVQEGTSKAYADCGMAFGREVAKRIGDHEKGSRYPALSASYPQKR